MSDPEDEEEWQRPWKVLEVSETGSSLQLYAQFQYGADKSYALLVTDLESCYREDCSLSCIEERTRTLFAERGLRITADQVGPFLSSFFAGDGKVSWTAERPATGGLHLRAASRLELFTVEWRFECAALAPPAAARLLAGAFLRPLLALAPLAPPAALASEARAPPASAPPPRPPPRPARRAAPQGFGGRGAQAEAGSQRGASVPAPAHQSRRAARSSRSAAGGGGGGGGASRAVAGPGGGDGEEGEEGRRRRELEERLAREREKKEKKKRRVL
eukprot:tig00000940_g5545.t1